MPTVSYDRQTDEQQQLIRRIEHALGRMKERVDFTLDGDGLGVRVYASSGSILREVHQIAFSTFEFPGVEKVGQRYRTHFRLR